MAEVSVDVVLNTIEQVPELTVLMPCLNEAETLGRCIEKARAFLDANEIRGEILVADNGSTDGSKQIAGGLGARVIEVAERGYGAALLAGIGAARGRYIVMGDADDSYDFTTLCPFVEALRSGADLVIGNRFKGGIEPGAMPFLHKYVGNPILSFLGRLFFRVRVSDFHCGLRAFTADAVRGLKLNCTGMEFASELVVRSALAGLRIEEVPTALKPDGRSRAPHLKTWRDGWRHLKFLLMFSPRWLFFIPGTCLMVIGLLLGAALSWGPIKTFHNVVLDISTFISACFLAIVGVQLVSFGAISRHYAGLSGFLPPSRGPSAVVFRYATTEHLALCGFVIAMVGAAVFGYALHAWAARGFGPLPDPIIPRIVLIGMTLIAIGIQVVFTGFVLGILEVPTTKTGDPAERR